MSAPFGIDLVAYVYQYLRIRPLAVSLLDYPERWPTPWGFSASEVHP